MEDELAADDALKLVEKYTEFLQEVQPDLFKWKDENPYPERGGRQSAESWQNSADYKEWDSRRREVMSSFAQDFWAG